MTELSKDQQILDALQTLLENKSLQSISVSEIAQAAGIGKGSIYYYFPSKDAIFDALIQRNYEEPLKTAQTLCKQTDIPPFTRMAMIFQACRDSSSKYLSYEPSETMNMQEQSYLHQKYMNHIITSLKPLLTDIIQQSIDLGEIQFDYPEELAEIVLIVLTVKLDTMISPSTTEETARTLRALVSLLEKGTDNPTGSLNFLIP